MKFSISGKALTDVVSQAALFHSSDASHPAYSLTKMDVTKTGALRLSVANAVSGCRFMSAVTDSEQGSVCVPSDVLRRVTAGIGPQASVSFYTDGTVLRFVDDSGFKGAIPTADTDMFISLKTPPADGWSKIASKDFEAAANQTAWAASHNHAHTVLLNVHLTPEFTEASNGHQLARKTPGIVESGDYLVSAAFISSIRTLLAGSSQDLMISGGRQIWIRGRGWAVYTLPTDAVFYDTSPVFYDAEAVNRISISRPHLHKALIKIMKSVGGRPLLVDVDEDKLSLSARGEDGMASAAVTCEVPFVLDSPNPDLEELGSMSISSELLRDAVNAYSCDVVSLLWTGRKETIQLDADGLRVAVSPIYRS
jgi:DNA polymerase III sliding clamp (beta) subunit (PCNA family)